MTGGIEKDGYSLVGFDFDQVDFDNFQYPFNTYWETSPSGNGVRGFAWVPTEWSKEFKDTTIKFPNCDHVEIYIGSAARFLTVTFNAINPAAIAKLQGDDLELLGTWLNKANTNTQVNIPEAIPGIPVDFTRYHLSDDQQHLLNGTGNIDRSNILHGLIIKMLDAGELQDNLLASMLKIPALQQYLLDHRNNNAEKAIAFAREEINRAFPKSMAAKRESLISYSENWKTDPVASTAPRTEQKPTRHGFEAPYLDALWDDNLAIDWMINGVLENKTIAEIWGPAGAYKSFTAFDMAVAIASGQDWHARKVERQGPVLYVPGEGGRRNIVRRLKVLCQERGLGPQRIRISNMPVLLSKPEQYEFLRDEIAKFDAPPVLVIIDTLAKNFGGNENSAEDMGAFLDNLGKLSRNCEATILIIHHCGYDGTHSRGSYALHGGVDAEYQAIADKGTKTLILKNEKMKDAEEGKSFYFDIKVVGLKNETTGEVINDDEGNPITSIVLRTSNSQYAAAREAFFKNHPVFKSKGQSKIEKRLPRVLRQARFHPECSDRQMAQVVDPAVADHSWASTLRALMLSEGLVEGEHFRLTTEGEQAAIAFDPLAQLAEAGAPRKD